MATALRPWVRAASMRSRNGSQALAVGARPGHHGVGRYRPRGGRVCCGRVGGHLPGNGRFCRLCRRPPWAADRQPRRLQIGADRLAAAPGRLFDAPERPSQAPKRPSEAPSSRRS